MITQSYQNFRFGILRTKKILELGILGILGEQKKLAALLEKLNSGKKMSDDLGDNGTPTPARRENQEGVITLTLDDKEFELIKFAVGKSQEFTDDLNFHLHGILCVAIWGSFETYVQGMVQEVYAKHPRGWNQSVR
jgi:hypothetical protein